MFTNLGVATARISPNSTRRQLLFSVCSSLNPILGPHRALAMRDDVGLGVRAQGFEVEILSSANGRPAPQCRADSYASTKYGKDLVGTDDRRPAEPGASAVAG